MAGEWGTREEFLHPRDSHGRFRKSWKMAASVIEKLSAALAKFNPKTFASQDEANNYVRSLAQSDRFLTNRGAFMDRFLKGYSKVNADLRAGKTNPDAAAMDKAMRPLPNDLILSRTVGPEAFGLDASNIAQMEEYTGKLVSDKGFSSTNIGTPHRRQGGITMVIAAPAGTRAVAPGTGTPTSEIILDRDQPFRITKVTPDGAGGFYVMAVATEKGGAGQTRTRTLGNAAPTPNAEEIAQPPAVRGEAPQTPQAPNAPQAPAAPAPQAAPVRTGRPGRPATPVQPRNEPVHAESIGTGNAPAAPQTPKMQQPTPEAPATPEAPSTPEAPPAPEGLPDPRPGFRDAFKKADIPVPGQGPRRATYNKAYLALADRRTDPNEVVGKLDHEIALNDATIKSDVADGTDSGPLPEDNKRLKLLSQFLKDHFGLEGAKPKQEEKATPAEKAAPSAPTPKKAGISDAEIARQERERKTTIRKEVRSRTTPVKRTPEQEIVSERARAAAEQRAAAQEAANAEIDAKAAKVSNGWLADAGVQEADLTDFQKTGLRVVGGLVAQKKISRAEAAKRLRGDNPTMNKIADAISKDVPGSTRTSVPVKPPAKKAVPAPSKPEIPAKDLTDKGLLQRFEAEIKKDEPDEKRLKELGDELDRRDLESAERIKALSDDDLEKQFQREIRKDKLDQEKVDKLGAELDRRDHERAQNEGKVDALMAKGRSFRDAYAEVHNKDPEKMDQEERAASVEAQRRPGESREATIRRLFEDDLRRQYVDAEKVTRGHLLTPEGRSKGIDPKSLFQGNSIRSNKWASDELKEYWEKNPRKTYTQFKADLLKRPQDVAAAKKTQGIQKDLDLGMKIERGPRKSIKAPSDIDAAYNKTTVAQLREQAKEANIEVPKSLRLKRDIFDYVTQELAKREQGRRGGIEAKAPETPKPETPKPERLTPHMAVGKTNASRINTGDRVLVRQGPDGVWRASPTKTGATPITVTEKRGTTKPGRTRSQSGYQIVGEDDQGNRIEVRPGPGIQTYWTAPEKGEVKPSAPAKKAAPPAPAPSKPEPPKDLSQASATELRKIAEDEGIEVPKSLRSKDDLVAHIEWERTFKRPDPVPGVNARIELFTKNPAEAKKSALNRELGARLNFAKPNDWPEAKRNRVAQALNDYMAEEGSASPWRLRKAGPEEQRLIRDIDSVMDQSPMQQDTTLWRGIGNAEDIFTPEQLKGSLKGTSFNDPGYASTSPNREVSERFAESNSPKPGVLTRLHVPKGTKAVHLADEDQDEVLLERGLKFEVTGDTGPGSKPRILDVTVSKAPSNAAETPKAVRQPSGKAPTAPGTPERLADVGARLKATQSREEARELLSNERLTVPQLRALADSLNIAVRGNKDTILKDLIHWTVGRRLDSAAVSKAGDTGADLRRQAGLKPGVSTKPILPNSWGTGAGGPIDFHDHGHIGRAIQGLGTDNQHLEVPGEDDNLANVLGKIATKGVRGDLTQNQMITEVRKVRDKMSSVPKVRQALDSALKDMEAPEVDLPKLPEGTPPRINKLMADLAKIPLARQDRMGRGPGTSELDRLADIMVEWSKGRMTPLKFLAELERVLHNNRHESEEGKFEIDRIVVDALKDLRNLLKTDRKALYPPIMRS